MRTIAGLPATFRLNSIRFTYLYYALREILDSDEFKGLLPCYRVM